MSLELIGINEKILNLSAVALIEDTTDSTGAKALVTFTDGLELEFDGDDADQLFKRAELIMAATEELIRRMQLVGVQQ